MRAMTKVLSTEKSKVATVRCPECNRRVRPCNLQRHRRGQHLPKGTRTRYGRKFKQPVIPITVGRDQDRRYDEIAPRGDGPERHRLYRLRTGELQLLATCGTPEAAGLGLFTLWSEGEFDVDDSAGWLDTLEEPGHWVANPWALGRRPPKEEAE
jgi:hypothetical protein